MDVYEAVALIAGAGALGGLVNGLITYDGILVPLGAEKKNVTVKDAHGDDVETTVKVWSLGFVGQLLIGVVAAVLVWCIYSQPELDLSNKDSYEHVKMTMYQLGTALVAGLGGTKAIVDLVDKKQWASLAPVLQRTDPSASPVTGARPVQVLQQIGN
jgi:hypothetical protein